MFLFKLAMFRRAFERAACASAEEGFIQLVDTVFGERGSRAIIRLSKRGIIFPIMGANDSINVVGAGDFNVGFALGDINAVEVFKFSKIVNGRFVFEGKHSCIFCPMIWKIFNRYFSRYDFIYYDFIRQIF